MQTGFDTTDVLLLHRQGLDSLLPDGFGFWWRGRHYRHKPAGHTDGMSSPQFTHVVNVAEPYGWALPASVPHDGGYHGDLELEVNPGEWHPVEFTKDECDQCFNDLLGVLANGNEEKICLARAFYEAVHLFGQSSYDAGHKANV